MQPQGRVLGGRYELTSHIAGGGMGQVWQARDRVLGRDVAVKLLRSEYTADPAFLARFRAEAQHAAGLVHPNIATLFDYGETSAAADGSGEAVAWLVMELVRGESLSALLDREHRLGTDRALDVLRQSAAGLAAAHAAGVVHRDVKPGNVLLGTDGRVKITDFGIAVSAASARVTEVGQVVGTAQYLAPEVAAGGRATPASDVYSLGLVAYECLAGHQAYDGESSLQVALRRLHEPPAPLPPGVPPPVRHLIERTLARDPAQRFPDGAALRAAVDALGPGRAPDGPTAVLHPGAATTVLGPGTAVPGRPADGPRTAVLPAVPPGDAAGTRVFTPGAGRGPVDPPPPAAAPPRRGRGRRWLLAALALVVVALLAFAATQLTGSSTPSAGTPSSSPTPSPSSTSPAASSATSRAPAPSTTAGPAPVQVDAGDYVGRPLGAVQAALTRQGLRVVSQPGRVQGAPDGKVLDVSPTGTLAVGDTVTITYAAIPDRPGRSRPSDTPTPDTPTPKDSKPPKDTPKPPKSDTPTATSPPTSAPATSTGGASSDG